MGDAYNGIAVALCRYIGICPPRLVVEAVEGASDFRKIGFNSRFLILGPWKVIAKA